MHAFNKTFFQKVFFSFKSSSLRFQMPPTDYYWSPLRFKKSVRCRAVLERVVLTCLLRVSILENANCWQFLGLWILLHFSAHSSSPGTTAVVNWSNWEFILILDKYLINSDNLWSSWMVRDSLQWPELVRVGNEIDHWTGFLQQESWMTILVYICCLVRHNDH